MIVDISEDGQFAVISAFNTPAGLDPSEALKHLRGVLPQTEVQFFNATRVAGAEHLKMASINALRAVRTGVNISKSLAMETLLYASAQRQIDVAIEMLGVAHDCRTISLVAFCESRSGAENVANKIAQSVGAQLDDTLLDRWSREKATEIMAMYDIDAREIEAIRMPGQDKNAAISKAVVERIALLSTRS